MDEQQCTTVVSIKYMEFQSGTFFTITVLSGAAQFAKKLSSFPSLGILQ